jgi:hypothetical protein
VDFKELADRAKALIGKRGGTESVKHDASEVRDISRGDGTTEDKLKRSDRGDERARRESERPEVATSGREEPPAGAGGTS